MASHQSTEGHEWISPDGREKMVDAVDYRCSVGRRELEPIGVEVIHELHPGESGGMLANAAATAAETAQSAKDAAFQAAGSAAAAVAQAARSAKEAITGGNAK